MNEHAGREQEVIDAGRIMSEAAALRAQIARLEAEAAPLRAALEQLKNVAKGIAHCYDELDEDERRELQQVCAESEAILLSDHAGKGWLPLPVPMLRGLRALLVDIRKSDGTAVGWAVAAGCWVEAIDAALDALRK